MIIDTSIETPTDPAADRITTTLSSATPRSPRSGGYLSFVNSEADPGSHHAVKSNAFDIWNFGSGADFVIGMQMADDLTVPTFRRTNYHHYFPFENSNSSGHSVYVDNLSEPELFRRVNIVYGDNLGGPEEFRRVDDGAANPGVGKSLLLAAYTGELILQSHSRFEHSIGTVEVAQRMLDALKRRDVIDEQFFGSFSVNQPRETGAISSTQTASESGPLPTESGTPFMVSTPIHPAIARGKAAYRILWSALRHPGKAIEFNKATGEVKVIRG